MEVLISGQIQSTDYFASFVETVHRCCRSAPEAAEVFHALSLLPKERMVGGKTGIRIRYRIRVGESGDLPALVDQTWEGIGAAQSTDVLDSVLLIPDKGACLCCIRRADLERETI